MNASPPSDYAPSELSIHLERPPDLVLEWTCLGNLDLDVLCQDLGRLLYAVTHKGRVLYLGKSVDLQLRLGHLVGGFVSGDKRLHGGGSRMRLLELDPANLQVEVFTGDELFRQHFHLVWDLTPPANRQCWLFEGRKPGRGNLHPNEVASRRITALQG